MYCISLNHFSCTDPLRFICSVQARTVTTSLQQQLTLLSDMHVTCWYYVLHFLNMIYLIFCLDLFIFKPLQKLMVRSGICKISLSPPVFLELIVPRRYFLWRFLEFYVLAFNFCAVCPLCTFSYFPLKSSNLVDPFWENGCSFGMFS